MNQFLRITGICALLIGFSLLAQPAEAAAFLKLGDIEGESQDREHQGWSDIESFSQASALEDNSSGRRRGCPIVSPLEISKTIDSASVPIQFAMLRGQVFPTAQLDLVRSGGDGSSSSYLVYELQNVLVSSHEVSGDSDDLPTETLTLNFEEIKVEYIPIRKDGSPGTAIVDSYDVSACK